MKAKDLIHLAEAARERAYAPYSNYLVGAALLGKSGQVYLGCNVETAASPVTNCAERTAFFKAVSEGERAFQAIAIVGGKKGEKGGFCPPCGVCRQVMAEFCAEDFPIVLGTADDYKIYTLSELLPQAFTPKSRS